MICIQKFLIHSNNQDYLLFLQFMVGSFIHELKSLSKDIIGMQLHIWGNVYLLLVVLFCGTRFPNKRDGSGS